MNDCKLNVEVKDGVVTTDGKNLSVEDLAQIAGFLQVFVGMEALARGLSLDDVKDSMLDIYFASMQTLEELHERNE